MSCYSFRDSSRPKDRHLRALYSRNQLQHKSIFTVDVGRAASFGKGCIVGIRFCGSKEVRGLAAHKANETENVPPLVISLLATLDTDGIEGP